MIRNPKYIKIISEQVARQISGKAIETEELIPEFGLDGDGFIYCYEYGKRSYVKVSTGQKVYVIDYEEDELKRVLIYTSCGRLVEVEFDKLIYTCFD